MLFNSFTFLIFFSLFYPLFYYVRGRTRLVLLLIASSVFYAFFIPEYLLILYLTILIDYFAAIGIESSNTTLKRKVHLIAGILNTCAVLFIFKYHNFWVDNINLIFGVNYRYWDIILPIGLSFHVFQSLSYVVEVYRKNIRAEKDLISYSVYVMMFPQLVAGPIERAGNMLPQIKNSMQWELKLSDFMVGITQFFYGLFKKAVVADNLGLYVDSVYGNYTHHTGSTMLVATFMFALQIYCDFSGYSDMAIGIAKSIGFSFNKNFDMPYFSKSVTEFWRRWHISLSNWLRDYIYIGLGGSRGGKFLTYRNLFITMLLGGLWHGASWNFVIWGGLNGLLLSVEKLLSLKINRNYLIVKILGASYTFIAICITWVFFRAATYSQATYMLKLMSQGFKINEINFLDTTGFATMLFSIVSLFACEYFIFRKFTYEHMYSSKYGMISCYSIIVTSIILMLSLGRDGGASFIYFQF